MKMIFKSHYPLVLFLITALAASAQKLPNVQENSQWLPGTVQIDGKLSEWNNSLQAYNKAALVEYTIANDDKNLYLAISSKDKTTTAKILAGGISLILTTSSNNSHVITFPLPRPAWIYSPVTGYPEKNYQVLSDSTAIRTAITELKELKVLGLNGVSDSILSVYNEFGIRSRLAYNNEVLICELSIPFDRIGLSNQGTTTFNYKVRVNGMFPLPPRPPGIPVPARLAPPIVAQPGVVAEREMWHTTDFDGKYTLAKK